MLEGLTRILSMKKGRKSVFVEIDCGLLCIVTTALNRMYKQEQGRYDMLCQEGPVSSAKNQKKFLRKVRFTLHRFLDDKDEMELFAPVWAVRAVRAWREGERCMKQLKAVKLTDDEISKLRNLVIREHDRLRGEKSADDVREAESLVRALNDLEILLGVLDNAIQSDGF